jgi:hypothetical protein
MLLSVCCDVSFVCHDGAGLEGILPFRGRLGSALIYSYQALDAVAVELLSLAEEYDLPARRAQYRATSTEPV